MRHFELTTHLPAVPEDAFDTSLDIDVHTTSMTGSGERAVGGVTSGRMRLGDQVTWQARHFGVLWNMTSRISAYDRPGFFVDEQVAGPFRRWCHEHHFTPGEDGDTVMRDVVEYAAPLGPLGAFAESTFLHRYMVRLIVLRNRYIVSVLADRS